MYCVILGSSSYITIRVPGSPLEMFMSHDLFSRPWPTLVDLYKSVLVRVGRTRRLFVQTMKELARTAESESQD